MYHREANDFGAAISGPSVLVNCFTTLADVPTVLPDDEEGGHLVGRHLLELGHRRVGFLTLWPEIAAMHLRQAGLMRAYREAGVSFSQDLVLPGQDGTGPFDQSIAFAAARSLLDREDRPTAVFCGNDEMALQVYNAAAELGLRIPSDLSVVGFDDYRLFSEGVRPGLTTVALSYHRMGRIAADLLLDSIAGGPPPTEVIRVQGPLVVRHSTAPLP